MTRPEALEEVARVARLVVDPPTWETPEWLLLSLKHALEDLDRAQAQEEKEEG